MRNRFCCSWKNREVRARLLGGVVLTMAAPLAADTHATEDVAEAVAAEFGLTVASQYHSRGQRVTEDEPVLQPGAALTVHNLTGWVWGNLELLDGNGRQGQVSEVALGLDWEQDFADWTAGLGIQESIQPGDGSGREAYVSVAWETVVTPAVQLIYEAGDVHGLYGELSLAHALALGVAWTLETRAHIGVASPALALAYWGVETWALHDAGLLLGLGWQPHPSWTVTPSLQAVSLLDADLRDAAETLGTQPWSIIGALSTVWSF